LCYEIIHPPQQIFDKKTQRAQSVFYSFNKRTMEVIDRIPSSCKKRGCAGLLREGEAILAAAKVR
jgi:hypothetical protein